MNTNELGKLVSVLSEMNGFLKTKIHDRFVHEIALRLTCFLLFNCLDFQLKDIFDCETSESDMFEMSKRV